MGRLENVKEIVVDTPFGATSGPIVHGTVGKLEVLFLPRHGKHHAISPSSIPHKANIYALKKLGCDRVLSISAVGSLKEDRRPGKFVHCNDSYY